MVTKKISRKVDVIFTGLIRKPERFKKSVKDLKVLKKRGIVGNIILANTKGDIDSYSGLRRFIKTNQIILIESSNLKDPGVGHVWYQMLSLDSGLKKANPSRFILKTRPDLYIKQEYLKKLFSKNLEIKENLPNGNVFKYKVWIPWFEITKPFYMADECFFGHYHDLKKLYNYSKIYDSKYDVGHGITHIRRFLNPFLEKYSLFKLYLESHTNLGFPSDGKSSFLKKASKKIIKTNRFTILNKKLKDPEFLKILYLYYRILHSHFFIDSRMTKNPIEFDRQSEPIVHSDPFILENNFKKDKVRLAEGQIYVYDEELLNNLFSGDVRKTKMTKRILDSNTKKSFRESKGIFFLKEILRPVLEKFRGTSSLGDPLQGKFFQSIISFSKAKTIVEIGVARGGTTPYLCRGALKNKGKVYGFDLWDVHGLQSQFPQLGSKESVSLRLKMQGLRNFTLTKVNSKRKDFPKILKNKCPVIDFAFIDGDHSYEGIKNDFDAVYPLLSKKGIVAFHDTQRIDGCREFIIDLRTKYNDGTFDIIDLPFGGKRKNGTTLLVKRTYPVLGMPIDEICGSPSKPDKIYKKENDWYNAETKQ